MNGEQGKVKIEKQEAKRDIYMAGRDIIIQQPSEKKLPSEPSKVAIVLFYQSKENELFAARLSIKVRTTTNGNGHLTYTCPSSRWQKLSQVVWSTVDATLRKVVLRGLGRMVQPSREQSFLHYLLSRCHDYEIEIKVEPTESDIAIPSEDSMELSITLAMLAVLKGFDLNHEVAVCTGLFLGSKVEFSDDARVMFQKVVTKFSIVYALCDPDVRDCSLTDNHELVWVSTTASIVDVWEFLLWKQDMPLFKSYLTKKSFEKDWHETAKFYTALEARGGDVQINTVAPFWPNEPFSESEAIDLARAIDENDHVVILGDPGTGKSWALIAYAYRLICQSIGKKIKITNTEIKTLAPLHIPKIPIYVNMRNYAESTSFNEFIIDILQKHIGPLGKKLDELLRFGCFLFLIDSINELQGENYDEVTRQIRDFKERYANNRFVFASRTLNYSPKALDVSNIYKIQPLDKERQLTLLANYLKDDFNNDQIEQLYEQIQNAPSLQDIAVNPLHLALILSHYERAKTLPKNRRELLENFLIDKYEWGRKLFPNAKSVLNILSGLALHMVDNLSGATSIRKDKAISVLEGELNRVFPNSLPRGIQKAAETIGDNPVEIVYDELRDKDILRQYEDLRDGNLIVLVSFLHQACQEFLAGKRFVGLYKDSIPETLRKRLVSMSWDEAAILLVPYLGPEDMRKVFVSLAQIDMILATQCFLKAREEYIDPLSENALIEEMANIAKKPNEIPAKRHLAIEALAQMKSVDASKKLIEFVTEFEGEFLTAVAEVAVKYRPPQTTEVVQTVCKNALGKNLGITIVSLLKIDFPLGVRSIVKDVSVADSTTVELILDHLMLQKDSLALEGNLSKQFHEWLKRVVDEGCPSVSVKAALLLKELDSEHECFVSIDNLKDEFYSDKEDKCLQAIKTAQKMNLHEATLHLVDILTSVSYEIRKAVQEALSSLARIHNPNISLENIHCIDEIEACLAIIASTQRIPAASDLEKAKIGEELINILLLDNGRLGWSAGLAFALMDNPPSKLEAHLLSLAKGLDESVAARSLFALSASENAEIILSFFLMLSQVNAEPLAMESQIPEGKVVFLRELAYAILRQLSEHPEGVRSNVTEETQKKALTNLRRLRYACFIDKSNVGKVLSLTQEALMRSCTPYADQDGPLLSVLFDSESGLDRRAGIMCIAFKEPFLEKAGSEYYYKAFPAEELRLYLKHAENVDELLFAIIATGNLGYKELLPNLYDWLNPEAETLPPYGLRDSQSVDRHEIVVKYACQAIGLIKEKESILPLSNVWKDSNKKNEEPCGKPQGINIHIPTATAATLWQATGNFPVKKEIANALKAIGSHKPALDIYKRMFPDSTPETAKTIASLLSEVGDVETAIYLNKLANDSSQFMYIRDAAWEALQTINSLLRTRVDLQETKE
jgi:HEAT repeat protein